MRKSAGGPEPAIRNERERHGERWSRGRGWIVTGPSTVRLGVKVVPGASRTEIAGWLGDELKIRVSQPPEKGKANRQVEEILCRALSLPAGSVRIVRGTSSPRKLLEIAGLSMADIRTRLAAGGRRPSAERGSSEQ